MDKQINDLMAFAEQLLLRDDINDLTQTLERTLHAECETDAELITALTVNFATFVLCLAQTPKELTILTQMIGDLIGRSAHNRYHQLVGHSSHILQSATVH